MGASWSLALSLTAARQTVTHLQALQKHEAHADYNRGYLGGLLDGVAAVNA